MSACNRKKIRIGKSIVIVLLFLVACLFFLRHSNKNNAIVDLIDLKPYSYKITRKGFGKSSQIVYFNENSSSKFFSGIVKTIESSPLVKNLDIETSRSLKTYGDFSGMKGLSTADIVESVSFRSRKSEFYCVVSNATKYVIITVVE